LQEVQKGFFGGKESLFALQIACCRRSPQYRCELRDTARDTVWQEKSAAGAADFREGDP
jgi:hypothetical protein